MENIILNNKQISKAWLTALVEVSSGEELKNLLSIYADHIITHTTNSSPAEITLAEIIQKKINHLTPIADLESMLTVFHHQLAAEEHQLFTNILLNYYHNYAPISDNISLDIYIIENKLHIIFKTSSILLENLLINKEINNLTGELNCFKEYITTTFVSKEKHIKANDLLQQLNNYILKTNASDYQISAFCYLVVLLRADDYYSLLAKGFFHNYWRVKWAALLMLQYWQQYPHKSLLERFLNDPDWEVIRQTIRTISYLQTLDHLPDMVTKLASDQQSIRHTTLTALAYLIQHVFRSPFGQYWLSSHPNMIKTVANNLKKQLCSSKIYIVIASLQAIALLKLDACYMAVTQCLKQHFLQKEVVILCIETLIAIAPEQGEGLLPALRIRHKEIHIMVITALLNTNNIKYIKHIISYLPQLPLELQEIILEKIIQYQIIEYKKDIKRLLDYKINNKIRELAEKALYVLENSVQYFKSL